MKSTMSETARVRTMHLLGATVGVLLFSGALFAQGNFGRILGTVTDQTGAVLPGAAVSVIDVERGLTRSLVNNMVVGVTDGFAKELEIVGVGYRAEAQGPGALRLALGFSHPVMVRAPDGITFEVPTPTRIVVRGIDKESVGQVAANIRAIRKPEPYKGKGVRYAGERVTRKAGKAGKK